MKQVRLGVVSVSFRERTPREILTAAVQAGLSCIEWGSDRHAPCHESEKLHEIAALQRENGIVCSSYGTYFRLNETPLEELESYIRAAKILGTRMLRLWCGTKSGAMMDAQERAGLLSVCRQAAAIAEARDVTLCMECHRGTFTEDPDDAVWLMRSVDSAHFRMYWQPFQWQSADENAENARKIAPYADHIHVFQWKGDDRFPLADGLADWRRYIGAFSEPCTLLLEFMPNGRVEELAEEAAALKRMVSREP